MNEWISVLLHKAIGISLLYWRITLKDIGTALQTKSASPQIRKLQKWETKSEGMKEENETIIENKYGYDFIITKYCQALS